MDKRDRVIFTITTLRDDPNLSGRCVGYYFSPLLAVQAVTKNYGDIYELGYYPYCVIESVQQGIYSIDRTEHWYKWDKELEKYVSLKEKPEKFKNLVCFGIG